MFIRIINYNNNNNYNYYLFINYNLKYLIRIDGIQNNLLVIHLEIMHHDL